MSFLDKLQAYKFVWGHRGGPVLPISVVVTISVPNVTAEFVTMIKPAQSMETRSSWKAMGFSDVPRELHAPVPVNKHGWGFTEVLP